MTMLVEQPFHDVRAVLVIIHISTWYQDSPTSKVT